MSDVDQNSAALRGKAEAWALRLLREGATPTHVRDTTGVPIERLRALVAEQPGGRPTPRPSAPCPHVLELPVRVLHDHPANVRTDLGDPRELEQLQQSIREHGILEPLLVMRSDHRYVLLAGHRRLAAAVAAGLQRVPVRMHKELDEVDAVEAMLVENLQRADLTPLDEARAYQALIDGGRTQGQIAASIGKNQGHVSQRLALLNLTADEQAAVERKEIPLGEAYRAGRDRSANRRPHDTSRPKPRRVPHFTKEHTLAPLARAACSHEVTLKLGVACGGCWEDVIRADERNRRGCDT